MIRFENLSLTFRKNPKKSPLPSVASRTDWWEGMVGRGGPNEERVSFIHPHPCLPAGRLTLPHRRGRDFSENFKYL